jgi:chromosomal replication initiator protein
MPTLEHFWSTCLNKLENQLGPDQFKIWIKPLEIQLTDHALCITVPNQIFLQFVKERYLSFIETQMSEHFAEPMPTVCLQVKQHNKERVAPLAQTIPPQNAPSGKPSKSKISSSTQVGHSYDTTRLNPLFIFDTLVTGKANQLARAAAIQIAENLGTAYNPLFVYGGVGLGKTHLIQAIGNVVHHNNPQAKLRYIHAEKYVQDVVRAYQHRTFDEFKRYYHSLDLLLIDDIQFFVGKDRTQEEFFYAFNALVEGHKQIILTSDRYPKEITGIDDRLVSRFSWGLTVAIEPPELEMRVAILLKKAESESFHLDANVAFFIAKHIRSNVRELEGALKRVLAYARFTGQSISLESAKEALKDILAVGNRQISIENIQKTVADFYKIKIADMHSKKRTRDIARPRQVAMALAKDLTQMSLPHIGESFGGRDHTTVLHACRTIESMRQNNTEISYQYNILLQILRN